MSPKLPAKEAAPIAIASIGTGYDVAVDLRLKYCKGYSAGSRLIEIDDDNGGQDLVLPGGISIPNVSRSIKCDKGERTRFRSDVLSVQQKDAANTKTLAFDGVFITLYSVAPEKSQIVLCDHVKNAVPFSWDPPSLARFIETFGTHSITGIKMGGKDAIYVEQRRSSTLQPANVQKMLKEIADKRFLDSNGQCGISDPIYQ